MAGLLDELMKTEAGNSGGGRPPIHSAKQNSADDPDWSEDDWRKVWDGKIAVSSRGRALLHGGHRAGKGWPGKSEFPASWTRSDMIEATKLTWRHPDAFRMSGDRRAARRVVNGVMVEVQAYGPRFRIFRESVPLSGEGVFKNTPDGKIRLTLNKGVLDEEGWDRG
ncbi:MAG: hypothetical protein LKI24_17095 [Acidipropionibacterium sp.]|jgi:hypothetical protein|nr:hypothetical protein [Acidipropionibacterium sp.]